MFPIKYNSPYNEHFENLKKINSGVRIITLDLSELSPVIAGKVIVSVNKILTEAKEENKNVKETEEK